MNGVSRRNIEMGKTAVEFNRLHPDTDEGNVVAAKMLEEFVSRAIRLTTKQREGLIDKSAASAPSASCAGTCGAGAISHLAHVGRLAAREDHELGKSFIFKPSSNTYLAFLSAARTMATAAQAHKDLLIKHGLSESVLASSFNARRVRRPPSRSAPTDATRTVPTAKQIEVSKEIGHIVRVMDARNRQRFQDDGELLNSWISVSTVLGTPRAVPAPKDSATSNEDSTPAQGSTPSGSTPSASTDVRPAA